MAEESEFARLDGSRITAVWMQRGALLECIYLGPLLSADEDLSTLALARQRSRHENAPDAPAIGGLLPDPRTGWRGPTLLQVTQNGRPISLNWQRHSIEARGERLLAVWVDDTFGHELHISWRMLAGDVIEASTRVITDDQSEFGLERAASLLLPLPRGFDHVTHFAGRWADDMRAERLPIARPGLCWTSQAGKSAFAGGDYLVFDDEHSGARLGFHFAHSGDHETRVTRNEDGLVTLIAEEPVDTWAKPYTPDGTTTPAALFTWAADADALADAFHTFARHRNKRAGASLIAVGMPNPPRKRKVHFNTWEACAFDFDEARLMELAEEAAALGAERFVLDDGWFKGRSSDRAGLGDWTPDPDRFPNGLGTLIDHVQSLGMDFGLWVEPEMVSPDSDLYRSHPGWCVHDEGADRPTERNQLVLDLTRREAFDHIKTALDQLLSDNGIAYLKWDHNRRQFPRSGNKSSWLAGQFDWLVNQLRAAHPNVMIESCSSGGGRIDMRTLGACERFWPSDNNDPIERVRIMQAWSQFLPLEVLGNHVGPSPNPITGRVTQMDFRAKIAVFGHMGVEADPGAMSEQEREILKAHIALYKNWRDILHSGDYYRLDHPDPCIFAHMVVGKSTALALAAQTGFSREFDAAPVRLKGLDPAASYRVSLPLPWPDRAARYLPEKRKWRDGFVVSGLALMTQGLALPLTHPETAWLIALERVEK